LNGRAGDRKKRVTLAFNLIREITSLPETGGKNLTQKKIWGEIRVVLTGEEEKKNVVQVLGKKKTKHHTQ